MINPSSIEHFLAQLYTNEALRARFIQNPESVGREFGFDGDALQQLKNLDRAGLDLAADSFARKRQTKEAPVPERRRWFPRISIFREF